MQQLSYNRLHTYGRTQEPIRALFFYLLAEQIAEESTFTHSLILRFAQLYANADDICQRTKPLEKEREKIINFINSNKHESSKSNVQSFYHFTEKQEGITPSPFLVNALIENHKHDFWVGTDVYKRQRTIWREESTWRIPMRAVYLNTSDQHIGNTWSPDNPGAFFPAPVSYTHLW